MVGRCRRSIGLVRPVDICADRLVKDVEAVELVHCNAYLGKSIAEGVCAGFWPVMREDWVEDAFEEGVSCMGGSNDTDR